MGFLCVNPQNIKLEYTDGLQKRLSDSSASMIRSKWVKIVGVLSLFAYLQHNFMKSNCIIVMLTFNMIL